MNEKLNQPKGFGEMLDLTFRLCKNSFSGFFMIFLIVLGPLYLIEAIILFLTGTSFFHETSAADVLFDQLQSSPQNLEESDILNVINSGGSIATLFIGLAALILLPITRASVLFGVDQLKNNQLFTAKMVLKRAFSKFWSIFFSSLLFAIIVFGMVFVGIMGTILIGVLIGSATNTAVGILLGILLFLGMAVVVALLIVRWNLFLGVVVIEGEAPGLSRSWRITHKNTWKILGFFIVMGIITSVISSAIGGVATNLLGPSVLNTIITDLVSLLTGMISAVAYAIIYHDMKIRHDGDDLKEMIDDYN